MAKNQSTTDLNEMLENMRAIASQQLSEIEADIESTQEQILILKKVSANDCFNLIVRNLKARRYDGFAKLEQTMQAASSLNTFHPIRNGNKKDGLNPPSFYMHGKKQIDSYSLKLDELAAAFITDEQIEDYANAASARFGCSSETKPAEQLAKLHDTMIEDLQLRKENRDELKKRIAGLFSVESQAKQLPPSPTNKPL